MFTVMRLFDAACIRGNNPILHLFPPHWRAPMIAAPATEDDVRLKTDTVFRSLRSGEKSLSQHDARSDSKPSHRPMQSSILGVCSCTSFEVFEPRLGLCFHIASRAFFQSEARGRQPFGRVPRR